MYEYVYIYIYIYTYVCVCVCVCVLMQLNNDDRAGLLFTWLYTLPWFQDISHSIPDVQTLSISSLRNILSTFMATGTWVRRTRVKIYNAGNYGYPGYPTSPSDPMCFL